MTPSCAEHYDKLYADSDYCRGITTCHKMILGLRPWLKKLGVRNVLDVGCGRGRMINGFISSGFKVFGTEISIALLRGDLYGHRILPLTLKQLMKKGAEEWDFVIYSDVLNHLWEPSEINEAIQWGSKARIGCLVGIEENSLYATTNEGQQLWKDRVEANITSECSDQREGNSFIIYWTNA